MYKLPCNVSYDPVKSSDYSAMSVLICICVVWGLVRNVCVNMLWQYGTVFPEIFAQALFSLNFAVGVGL